MEALRPYTEMLDRVMTEKLGLKPQDNKISPTQWLYVKFSTISLIEVNYASFGDKNVSYLQSFTPICKMPRKRQEFMAELLKLNHGLIGAFFALYESNVILKMIRDCEGLDDGELETIVKSVGYIGGKLNNPLIKLHNAQKIDVTMAMLQKMAKMNPIKL